MTRSLGTGSTRTWLAVVLTSGALAGCGAGGSDGSTANNGSPAGDASTAGEGSAANDGSTAAAGHSVALSWNASATAGVTYNLYRGTASGGPYAEVQAGITSTAATDVTVSSNTTYYYVIRSHDSAGESGNSNQVVAVVP
jgi:hypothetical protein